MRSSHDFVTQHDPVIRAPSNWNAASLTPLLPTEGTGTMGDADRTPDDVIAEWTSQWFGQLVTKNTARKLIAALAAEGLAVVPQADVDAATRLRAENETLRAAMFGPVQVGSETPDGEDARLPECELPGMWEYADFEGGQDYEVRGPDWTPSGDNCDECQRGRNCAAHGGRPGIPARPSRCPTCGSDDPAVLRLRCWQFTSQANRWHSPDPDTTSTDRWPGFPFVEVQGVKWCYVHEAEFVEGNPECGMGDQSELPCQTIGLFYRAGDS